MSQYESWRLNGGTINKNCMAAAALWWRPGFLQLHSSVAATEWQGRSLHGGIVACLQNIGSSRSILVAQYLTKERLRKKIIPESKRQNEKKWLDLESSNRGEQGIGRYHRQACRDGSYEKEIWGPGLRPARVLRIDQLGGGCVARLVPDLGQSMFTRSSDVTRAAAIALIKTHTQ